MIFGKNDLITHVTKEASVSKEDAEKSIKAVFSGITDALKAGKQVKFVGFGTFVVQQREASQGRNPRTGEPIQIAAYKKPAFRAGKELKDVLNAS